MAIHKPRMIILHRAKKDREDTYNCGYAIGRTDALADCEKCELDQWDAIYRAEQDAGKEAINDFVNAYINDKYDCEHCDRDDEHCCIKCFRDRYLQKGEQ